MRAQTHGTEHLILEITIRVTLVECEFWFSYVFTVLTCFARFASGKTANHATAPGNIAPDLALEIVARVLSAAIGRSKSLLGLH